MTTVEMLLERMRQRDMERRRFLLAELAEIEKFWDIPRTVPPREERRHPTETLTANLIPSPR